jgi:hypothetical protein
MSGRYFGGHYDSVKQSSYLNFIQKDGIISYPIILDSYTARLRLDMLFSGQVVITDAMFFDGIFFQTMFLHDEKRRDFVNFLRLLSIGTLPPLLEIRNREATIDETILKMIYKKGSNDAFVFSSIGNDYTKREVTECIKITQNLDKPYSSWEEFLQIAKQNANGKVITEEIDQKIELFNLMKSVPQNILAKWEGKYNFAESLSTAKNQNRFHLSHTGDPVIDSVIKLMEIEIQQKSPNRSKLQTEISTKTDIFKRLPKTLAEKDLEFYWGEFLQVYNRTIGKQHFCDTYDIGEIPLSNDVNAMVTENLSEATIKALSTESWISFCEKFNKLNPERIKWLEEVWKLEKHQATSYKEVRKALDKYVSQILKIFHIKPSINDVMNIVGGGASIDRDLMSPNSMSFGVATSILKLPFVLNQLASKQIAYKNDKSNLIEYGVEFMQGIYNGR